MIRLALGATLATLILLAALTVLYSSRVDGQRPLTAAAPSAAFGDDPR